MTRAEAAEFVEAIHGAKVDAAELFADVVVIEFFHRGTDDDAWRLAFSIKSGVAVAYERRARES